MCWWRITTSEAALWLVVLFLSLAEVPGTSSSSSPGTHDKNDSQSRTKWCEQTNPCARCTEAKRPRCSKHGEPLLGADLCECCFSCVALRDLGESCGSQLSKWPDGLGSGPTSSSVTILGTTRCREGLVCVNFACLDPSDYLEPGSYSRFENDEGLVESKRNDDASVVVSGQDMIPLEGKVAFPTAERHQRTTTPLWEPIPVNHDDPNLPSTVSLTPFTSTPSPTASLTEPRKKPQPCYAEPEKTMTMSSHTSDDVLGRVATVTTLDGKRFQLVYSGDLLSELKVLLNVVDTVHEDSLLDKGAIDSLLDGFLATLSIPDDDGLLVGDEDYVDAFSGPRVKREVERKEEEVVEFAPADNIQEILIRGASAHQEYVNEARGRNQNADILDTNASVTPAEVTSQEDESTVRLQITNHPRKVQTLIDLEEDDEEAEGDMDYEDHYDLESPNRGHMKNAGKLSPFVIGQSRALPGGPRVLGPIRATMRNTVLRKVPKLTAEVVIPTETPSWTDVISTLNDRLKLVEVKVNFFEKFLDEIAKWITHGVFPPTGDCAAPQTRDMHYVRRGPEADEHLVLASGVDPVRIRGSRRKSNGNVRFRDTRVPGTAEASGIVTARQMVHRERNEPFHRNFFRSLIENGSPGRPQTNGLQGPGRPVKSPCRNSGDRRSSWRETSHDPIDHAPLHKTVQRSVSSTNPFSGLEGPTFAGATEHRDQLDDQGLPNLQKTQISAPGTSVPQGPEESESPLLEDALPEEWASALETNPSSDLPLWGMLTSDGKMEDEDQVGGFGVQRHVEKRSRRAAKRIGGIRSAHDTRRKVHVGSSAETRQAGELFDRETSTEKAPEADVDQSAWPEGTIPENGKIRSVKGPLIAKDDNEVRNSPEPMTSRLLFRNSDPQQTTESTATSILMVTQDPQKVPDSSNAAPYSITDHGNSTIRIEEISESEYDDSPSQAHGSSTAEDDFDHIYEGVEVEVEDGDFEYDVGYDQVDYVDGSSVEMVTAVPEPRMALRSGLDSLRGEIPSEILPRRRNLRASRDQDDECESAGSEAKRELPLLLFGSSEKHEPKTIVWPSKWTGYRRDRILGSGRSEKWRSSTLESGPLAAGSPPITTTPNVQPTKTTESLIVQHHLGTGDDEYVVTPKISGPDRRARKNRRKLIWR